MENKDKKIGIIYVISQARFIEGTTSNDLINGKFEYKPCIKIGFTTDKETRFTQYKCDCVSTIELFTVSDETITKEDEFRFHEYFKKYKVKDRGGKEWFDWNDEIIKFFQTYTTIEDMRKTLPNLTKEDLSKNLNKYLLNYSHIFCPVIPILYEVEYKKPLKTLLSDVPLLKTIHNNLLSYYPTTKEDILSYVELTYNESDAEYISERYLDTLKRMTEIERELSEFEHLKTYIEKMRFVCQLGERFGEVDKSKFELFLNSIPISFKNYYTVLGPIRCSAAKYQKGEMEKLYQAKVGNQDIDIRSEIFKNFKVGDRISNSDVKERLKTIYYSCGYKKTPKATDLETYFETKHCFVPIGDGSKRSHGFELVSKKE